MYTIIKFLSVIIRMFCLPNPFDPISGKFTIDFMGTPFPLTSDIINIFADGLLVPLAFIVAGLYYTKGEDSPAKGSFLFLLFYCVHIGLLWIISVLEFKIWAVVGVIALYVFALNGINTLKEKIFYGGD